MEDIDMAKTLIAFFSRADENYFGGAMRYVKVGNTEIVVNGMKDMIEADSFKIEMINPYSPVYMTCIDEAKADLRDWNTNYATNFNY
jgi:flavodoxin